MCKINGFQRKQVEPTKLCKCRFGFKCQPADYPKIECDVGVDVQTVQQGMYSCYTKAVNRAARKYTTIAAANGHYECLKRAHEQGYPWGTTTVICAIISGSLDCLQYAIEHGCPWQSSMYPLWYYVDTAFELGHLKCLMYLYNVCQTDSWRAGLTMKLKQGKIDSHNNFYDWNIYRYHHRPSQYEKRFKCLLFLFDTGCKMHPIQFTQCMNYRKEQTIKQTQKLKWEIIAAALHPRRLSQFIEE
jgi:hypothetical protein